MNLYEIKGGSLDCVWDPKSRLFEFVSYANGGSIKFVWVRLRSKERVVWVCLRFKGRIVWVYWDPEGGSFEFVW